MTVISAAPCEFSVAVRTAPVFVDARATTIVAVAPGTAVKCTLRSPPVDCVDDDACDTLVEQLLRMLGMTPDEARRLAHAPLPVADLPDPR